MIVQSYCFKDTFAVGKRMGERAAAGEIYCLDGDLGTGKTVFTQGFAAGLGILGPVDSPTFTIVHEYFDGRLPLYHFDVYRITDVDEMDEIGYEDYFYGNGVCLIEWASQITEILPKNRTRITIDKVWEMGFDYREILIEGRREND